MIGESPFWVRAHNPRTDRTLAQIDAELTEARAADKANPTLNSAGKVFALENERIATEAALTQGAIQ